MFWSLLSEQHVYLALLLCRFKKTFLEAIQFRFSCMCCSCSVVASFVEFIFGINCCEPLATRTVRMLFRAKWFAQSSILFGLIDHGCVCQVWRGFGRSLEVLVPRRQCQTKRWSWKCGWLSHQCDCVAPPVMQPSLGSHHHQCMSAVQRGDAHAWDSATWQALCPRHAQEHLLERIRAQDILIRTQADRIRVLEEMLQAQDTNTQETKPDVKRARRG